ncbi:MAG: tetratricopeptide repeat protein [Cytophagales bacterium]|nr:tetratricopeptide repeat protein [Bernardetiaceae bacterium]MDW8204301.1 tetratricopeptide repeat protein [Cytophagales bacterium]
MAKQKRKNPATKDILVQRFEQMLAEDTLVFFDLHEFEHIIDYYKVHSQWRRALKACETALAQYPFASELEIEKVQIWLHMRKYRQALEQIEKLIEHNIPLNELLVLQAYALVGLNQFSQAIKSLLKVLDYSEEKEEIHYQIAALYVRSGKIQQSLPHFFEVLRLNPDNTDALLELVDALITLYRTTEGKQFFEAQIDNNPENFRLWRNAGIFFNATGRFHKAIDMFEYALALHEADFLTWYYLGHAQMNVERYEDAQTSYHTAIGLKQQTGAVDPEMYCCLAATYEKRKHYDKASQLYRKAIHMDERCANGWWGIGICLIRRERWYEAINFLKKAVQLDSECEPYWLALAEAEAKTGNIVSAIEAYQHASHLNPANPQTWLDWSEIYREQGDYAQAITLLKDALEECPSAADLYYRLCVYCIEAGKYKQSFAYLENALILDFDRHTVLYEWIEDINIQKTLFKIISQYQR